MDTHPELLDLELLRTGEAAAEVAAHVQACATCQEQLRELHALRAAHPAPPPIPLSVARDNMLVELAQDSARRVRSQRRQQRASVRILRWAAPVAAAAGLVLAIGVPMTLRQGAQAPAAMAGDVNRDGRVDIVDALLLARALDEGAPTLALHDLDRDQRVSARDVELIARQAVRLVDAEHTGSPAGRGGR